MGGISRVLAKLKRERGAVSTRDVNKAGEEISRARGEINMAGLE